MQRFYRIRTFEIQLFLGYVGLVVVLYLLVAFGDLPRKIPAVDSTDTSRYYMLPLIGLPFVFSIGNALYGGNPVGSLMLGLAPGVVFVGLVGLASLLGTGGNGDTPLWALSSLLSGYGLFLSATGYFVGRGLDIIRNWDGG